MKKEANSAIEKIVGGEEGKTAIENAAIEAKDSESKEADEKRKENKKQ